MIDWPISHYPDDMKPIAVQGTCLPAYITDVFNNYLFGRVGSSSHKWTLSGKYCGMKNFDLVPPKREVERWFIWDHDLTNNSHHSNPHMLFAEEIADSFIEKHSGTKVKVMIQFPGDDNG